jgi:hypothetical protein
MGMRTIAVPLVLVALIGCDGPIYNHGPTSLHVAVHADDAWLESERLDLTYDPEGRLTGFEVSQSIDSNWVTTARTVLETDGRGRLVRSAQESFQGEGWVGVARVRLSYADSGVKTQRFEFFADGGWVTRTVQSFSIEKGRIARLDTESMAGGDVQHKRRDEFHYDGDLLVAQVGFVQIDGEWTSQDRVDLKYDADDLVRDVTKSVSFGSNQPLRPVTKFTYTHTAAARLATVEEASADDDGWETISRERFEYDDEGRVAARFTERSLGGVWTPRSRARFRYDAAAATSEVAERMPASANWRNDMMESLYGHAMPYRAAF